MAVTVVELFDSRQFDFGVETASVVLRYGLYGSQDDEEIRIAAGDVLETEAFGLAYQSHRITPFGGDCWYLEATYGNAEIISFEDRKVSYEVGSTTQHIMQSLSTIAWGKAAGVDGDVPDFKGAINVSRNEVNGVDIDFATFIFTETVLFSEDDITNAYLRKVKSLTNTVNNASFRGWEAGEVKFNGATIARQNADRFELTFRFEVSENKTGMVVNGSEPFDKEGWDYIWFVYADGSNADNLVKKVKYYYVERVYDRGDFSELGIGV
jgi:hypothetical protein